MWDPSPLLPPSAPPHRLGALEDDSNHSNDHFLSIAVSLFHFLLTTVLCGGDGDSSHIADEKTMLREGTLAWGRALALELSHQNLS